MKLVIKGQTPSQKNDKRIWTNPKTGRVLISSGNTTRAWKQDALWQLKGKPKVINYPVALTCVFYMKDNRPRDLDNCLAAVCDILQQAEIISNDSWQKLCPITLDCGGVDKEDPRVEVYLDD